MAQSDDNIIKNLNVILNEAKVSRRELLQYSNESLNHIWKYVTFLTLFIGLLITFTIYALENCNPLVILPLILSSIFIASALYLSLIGTLPSKSLLVPDPDILYGNEIEENEQFIKKVIQTYLIHNKKYMLQLEKKSFVREKIHLATIGSILEFIIFIVSCIYNQYGPFFNIVAYLSFWMILFHTISRIYDQTIEINQLKRELNLD